MKEVLHLLVDPGEGNPFIQGGALQIDTHGVQHVVLQLERPKRTYNKNKQVEVINDRGQRLLAHLPQKRSKTAACDFCHEKMAPQGKWKHEKFCHKNPKRAKKGNHS